MVNLGSKAHMSALRTMPAQRLCREYGAAHVAPLSIIPTGCGMLSLGIVALVAGVCCASRTVAHGTGQ